MKYKRAKKVIKYLSFFETSYNFRKPYQILLDGTFTNAALDNKVNIKDQIPKYMGGSVKLITTACIMAELQNFNLYGALNILKQFVTHRCSHKKDEIKSARECIIDLVQGKDHYIVATQDNELRNDLRNIPGIPILFLYGNSPNLEKPSEASEKGAKIQESEKLEVVSYQKEILNKLKGEENKEEVTPRKKRKRATGPNPLSIKKSKKPKLSLNTRPKMVDPKKKKRVRVKFPKHVKLEKAKKASSQGQSSSTTSSS